jgi:hypothetical protein
MAATQPLAVLAASALVPPTPVAPPAPLVPPPPAPRLPLACATLASAEVEIDQDEAVPMAQEEASEENSPAPQPAALEAFQKRRKQLIQARLQELKAAAQQRKEEEAAARPASTSNRSQRARRAPRHDGFDTAEDIVENAALLRQATAYVCRPTLRRTFLT